MNIEYLELNICHRTMFTAFFISNSKSAIPNPHSEIISSASGQEKKSYRIAVFEFFF